MRSETLMSQVTLHSLATALFRKRYAWIIYFEIFACLILFERQMGIQAERLIDRLIGSFCWFTPKCTQQLEQSQIKARNSLCVSHLGSKDPST